MQVTQLFLIPLIGLEPILSCEKGILSPLIDSTTP